MHAIETKELFAFAQVQIKALVAGTVYTPFHELRVPVKKSVLSELSSRSVVLPVAQEAIKKAALEWFAGLQQADTELKRRVGKTRVEVVIRHLDYEFVD